MKEGVQLLWDIFLNTVKIIFSQTYSDYDIDSGDTCTSNDIVVNQYESLPYPGFSAENISNEEDHYKKYDTPSSIYPYHTLEKLNHFLHGGSESFRLVNC